MLEALVVTAAVAAVIVAGVLLLAARRPATFEVARSIVIAASPEHIFPLIADPRAFNSWSPFNEDPSINGDYSGPPTGPGARYTFASRRAGTGYSEVAGEDAPRSVRIHLVMTRPIACDNQVEFRLAPEAGKTRVTWAMSGSSPFVAKVMGVFINCDKMCGDQFSRGLGKLKKLAEGPAERSSEAA